MLSRAGCSGAKFRLSKSNCSDVISGPEYTVKFRVANASFRSYIICTEGCRPPRPGRYRRERDVERLRQHGLSLGQFPLALRERGGEFPLSGGHRLADRLPVGPVELANLAADLQQRPRLTEAFTPHDVEFRERRGALDLDERAGQNRVDLISQLRCRSSSLRPGYRHDASQNMADEQGTDVLREPLARSSHQEEDYLSAENAPGPGAAQRELGGR